jgi:TonB family protein
MSKLCAARLSNCVLVICLALSLLPTLAAENAANQTDAGEKGLPSALGENSASDVRARALLGSCPRPEYPSAAIRAGESGTTKLAFLISSDGSVRERKVRRSSGYDRLDLAAIAAWERCSFVPANKEGVPYESWVDVEFAWRLDNNAVARPTRRVSPMYLSKSEQTAGLNWEANLDTPLETLPDSLRANFYRSYGSTISKEDVPPFPVDGIGAFYRPLVKAQDKLNVSGYLLAWMLIDKSGDVSEVRFASTPSQVVAKFTSQLAMLIKFKPALCRGVPCEMSFPLGMVFIDD